MDEKPRVTPIDKNKFIPGLDSLNKLKEMLSGLDQLADVVKGRAGQVDDTLNKLADFTNKFGETVVTMGEILEMNKKLFQRMMKNAEKSLDDITE